MEDNGVDLWAFADSYRWGPDQATVSVLLDYTDGDDVRQIGATVLTQFSEGWTVSDADGTLIRDESGFDTGAGDDTLYLDIGGGGQAVVMFTEIAMGSGDDVLLAEIGDDTDGAAFASFELGTGSGADQVRIDVQGTGSAIYDADIDTGSAPDVVAIHLRTEGESVHNVFRGTVALGSGDDVLDIRLEGGGQYMTAQFDSGVSAGDGNDVVSISHADTFLIGAADVPVSFQEQTFNRSGFDGGVGLGAGDDVLRLALNEAYGLTEGRISGGAGYDVVHLDHLAADRVYTEGVTASYYDFEEGDAVRLVYGSQIITVAGVEEVRFADGTVWFADDWQVRDLVGTDGADALEGGLNDDTFRGGGGNDTIDGNMSTSDLALYDGAFRDFALTVSAEGVITTRDWNAADELDEGFDTLRGVERLEFGDDTTVEVQFADRRATMATSYTVRDIFEVHDEQELHAIIGVDWRTRTFDLDGTLLTTAIEVIGGDLRTWTYREDGSVESFEYHDGGQWSDSDGTRPWDTIRTEYDADGNRTARVITEDDRDIRTDVFRTDGTLESREFHDRGGWTNSAGTRPWDTVLTEYDRDGNRIARTVVEDDGDLRVHTYGSDGLLETYQFVDGSGRQPWDVLRSVYDENGVRRSYEVIEDDGDARSYAYDEMGNRTNFTFVDGSDARDWASRTVVYDADGTVSDVSYVWDDYIV